MNIFLRLLAPFMPHICSEIWSWALATSTGYMHVHTAPYPTPDEFLEIISTIGTSTNLMDTTIACLGTLRKLKADAHLKYLDPMPPLVMQASLGKDLEGALEDIKNLMRCQQIRMSEDDICKEAGMKCWIAEEGMVM